MFLGKQCVCSHKHKLVREASLTPSHIIDKINEPKIKTVMPSAIKFRVIVLNLPEAFLLMV